MIRAGESSIPKMILLVAETGFRVVALEIDAEGPESRTLRRILELRQVQRIPRPLRDPGAEVRKRKSQVLVAPGLFSMLTERLRG